MTITDTAVDVSAPRLTLTSAQPITGLDHVARVFRDLDDVWVCSIRLALIREGRAPIGAWGSVPRPPHLSFGLASPLWIELAGLVVGGSATGGAAYGFMRHFLKHPEELGGWIPKVVAGWRRSWTDAERARLDLQVARGLSAGGERDLQSAVESFARRASDVSTRLDGSQLQIESANVPDEVELRRFQGSAPF